ncbi:hypothetical protein LTR37_009106 [Vermiconidia calcicola]|uniref:Uncharacterized protein n=1 Tax=Vermiconidia calcicola TaxID=1690605 RepID=A0ACC3NAC2_9PEZI|nr:hypothetical protein LTR37_009106 [Vermiconidia calcicola]
MSITNGLPDLPLPAGITEGYVDCTSSCGLNYHVLKAGKPGTPLILFCHGYPELAFSWRKVMPSIAEAGYYCIAMDQRGYGRTTGWENKPFDEVDLTQYTMTNLVRDLVCLVYKLGYMEVACIIGHDFGGVSSAMAALIRPDMFGATIQMSHPHPPNPSPQFGDDAPKQKVDIQAELAKLDPSRKHYKWYNCTPRAAHDWDNPPQGLEAYLRGYFHLKSADWELNKPHPLREWSAEQLAVMPEYYIMRREDTFPESVAKNMKGEDATKTESWLSAEALETYCNEWRRTGFQSALNWYRAQTESSPQAAKDLLLGKQDWGNYQQPGAFEAYEDESCVKPGCFKGAKLIDHAGHWVQQEQPEAVIKEVLGFLEGL